ncbi:3567_t:CDS:2 [Acaulospora morrowiae]|uniref:Phospholipid-transporting ATPase n=1 Tax=Acaulospora morrowiae TaxID=94023 RepID=A0A9N9F937_9GLOM|nr:3567_t:CDS:2 [Acaulospora morrowiae]
MPPMDDEKNELAQITHHELPQASILDKLRYLTSKLRTLFRKQTQKPLNRKIVINSDPLTCHSANIHYKDNAVRTSRYTFLSFLPKQLYAQFSRIANLYFLFVAILQAIPEWSPTGQFTTIIPLSCFLFLAMSREGYDDYRRHRQDQIENNQECLVLRGVWTKTKWKNLKVGDFVLVKTKEWIPADLLLLHSKGENGVCYIETAALDGETNLKQRQALEETNSLLSSPEALVTFQGTVEAESPNSDLYNFDGSITFSHGKAFPLTKNQMLLRGTILRNTPEVYGMVIFTGEETKLRMNATKNIRTKAPSMQRILNRVIIMIFSFVMLLSILCTTMSLTWEKQDVDRWYITGFKRNPAAIFFGFVIIFNTMIPISLYVTMEIIKLVQVYFINNDRNMYHKETDTPAEARTSTLNEELGQVSHIFSDKTGTLTENIMLLRKLSVCGFAFLHDSESVSMMSGELTSTSTPYMNLHHENLIQSRKSSYDINIEQIEQKRSRKTSVNFSMIAPVTLSCRNSIDSSRSKVLSNLSTKTTMDLLNIIRHQPNTPFGRRARFFLLSIALCHTCVAERDAETGEIIYQSSSPDEFALLTAAKELGYVFTNRSLGSVSLKFNNIPDCSVTTNGDSVQSGTYQILNVLEFSSERKMMSVIYQLPDGRICLFCKGADIAILERLRSPRESTHRKYLSVDVDVNKEHSEDLYDEKLMLKKTKKHVQNFSTDGLRTLLYAHRYIDKEEYDKWNELFLEASNSVIGRREKLEKVAKLIETDMEITGATGIEDRLQCGVPEAIGNLRAAGIKVWMLTGDKRETATNIGYSCSLIKTNSTIIHVDLNVNLNEMLKRWLKDVSEGKVEHVAVIIDGETLMSIEKESSLLDTFMELSVLCETVICCRVNPSQKALVVQSVRKKLKDGAVTLAIGDGANDIAMIQEAHVGIGIAGREGLQAARTSDYSIAQFKFLENLLFVHGRWSYVRLSKFVLGTFYKCICFYLTQGAYQIFTGFSGSSLYEQWTLAFYNTLFSSLPVMVVGMFEKDLNEKTLLGIPELYQRGQKNMEFNMQVFLSWMLGGLYHALVIVLTPALLQEHFMGNLQAESLQLFELGLYSYTCVVLVVTVKIAYLECHNWTIMTHLTSILTLLTWFLFQTVYSYVYPINQPVYSVNGTFRNMATKPKFWILVLLIVSIALLPSYLIVIIRKMVMPSEVDFYQEVEKDEEQLEGLIEGEIDEKNIDEKNHDEMINKGFVVHV